MRDLHRDHTGKDAVLISVHTPEFDHEKVIASVRQAAAENDLQYPIAIDNDWTIWCAYENRYWPALYLIDKQGRVRAHHAGELHVGTPAWEDWIAQLEALKAEG